MYVVAIFFSNSLFPVLCISLTAFFSFTSPSLSAARVCKKNERERNGYYFISSCANTIQFPNFFLKVYKKRRRKERKNCLPHPQGRRKKNLLFFSPSVKFFSKKKSPILFEVSPPPKKKLFVQYLLFKEEEEEALKKRSAIFFLPFFFRQFEPPHPNEYTILICVCALC